MGYIKEPEVIDFVIIPQTKPNKEADRLVNEFIKKGKTKRNALLKRKLQQAGKE